MRGSKKSYQSVSACLTALLFATVSFAQSDYGSISGFAKDPSGAAVPKAKMTVKNEATNEERSATTNDSGYYTVTNLQPGLYAVSAEAPGFKKFTSEHNRLEGNSTLSLDAGFTIGSAS